MARSSITLYWVRNLFFEKKTLETFEEVSFILHRVSAHPVAFIMQCLSVTLYLGSFMCFLKIWSLWEISFIWHEVSLTKGFHHPVTLCYSKVSIFFSQQIYWRTQHRVTGSQHFQCILCYIGLKSLKVSKKYVTDLHIRDVTLVYNIQFVVGLHHPVGFP